jgi:uncharacterized membrane protein YgcG
MVAESAELEADGAAKMDAASSSAATTAILPPVPRSTFAARPASGRQPRSGKLVAAVIALGVAIAMLAAFATLWQLERSHASRLQADLSQVQTKLALTRTTLKATRANLASTASLSDKRRAVLLQAQDVVAKVDSLLSAVDNIQGKAGILESQGSTMAGDAEIFISTVSDLVNYLVRSSGGYVDYAWVGQEIATANSQLAGLRYDESTFSSGDSSYGGASRSFGLKADAFSSSVRALQKQLKAVTSK